MKNIKIKFYTKYVCWEMNLKKMQDERGGVMNRSALAINVTNNGCSLAKFRYNHLIHICQ